jgi:hypothetical protein
MDNTLRKTSEPARIEASFRHGSVTVVGVLSGFSLTFLTAWAANPVPWSLEDLFGLAPLIAGIVFQLFALALLLDPNCLELPRYRRAIRHFLTGVILVALGVAIALAVDILGVAHLNVI